MGVKNIMLNKIGVFINKKIFVFIFLLTMVLANFKVYAGSVIPVPIIINRHTQDTQEDVTILKELLNSGEQNKVLNKEDDDNKVIKILTLLKKHNIKNYVIIDNNNYIGLYLTNGSAYKFNFSDVSKYEQAKFLVEQKIEEQDKYYMIIEYIILGALILTGVFIIVFIIYMMIDLQKGFGQRNA